MTESNETVEFIEEPPEKPQQQKGPRVKDFLNGQVLNRETVSNQLPYILFLAFLAVIYISNRYRYEKLVKHEQLLQKEVKNLRAESITTAAQLVFISKQSEVAKLVESKGLGLEESTVPPKKIR
jgi:hypothetical protein